MSKLEFPLQMRGCLHLRSLQVPDSVEVGGAARLVCLFDAEQDELYSVKWFKDDVEFFRFLPNDRPANQFFEIGDVDVDMSRSSNGTVYLRNASLSAEGNYRCEVSADAPSFQSISSEKFMLVEDKSPVLDSSATAFTGRPSSSHLSSFPPPAVEGPPRRDARHPTDGSHVGNAF
ncbi:ig-like domain-containing protein [Caerostris extrusa]|uniref:Ig-like domain-containing protein n=1 Tax=Caerostris extrusa TaxID=172846 RepID=A0AAV4YFX5_CAEEX|nr:ig-like domain-containing protein [Caerostris extrusa]